MAKRILITDAPWGNCDIEREILEPAGCEIVQPFDDDEQTLISRVGDARAIATCWADITPMVISAAPRCRHIARMGIGLDNIDIAAATAAGMIVTNVPDYCVEEVAHHALGLLLAHARQIGRYHHDAKRGIYNLRAAAPVRRLSSQTLGLIGFGRTARQLREVAVGIGLTVIAHSPSGDDYGTGCEMLPLDELLLRSDFISLHAPLNDDTRHLIDEWALSLMKPAAFLVNTSRGGLIDHDALWSAIASGRLGGAGLDVFDPEPPDLNEPLFQDERVIVTPHAAFVSEDAVIELRQRVAQQILDVLEGRTPENIVNP